MTNNLNSIIESYINAWIWLSHEELEHIIEHRWVFQKYIDVLIADIRINLANMQMKGNEQVAYIAIEIMEKMKNDMDNSVENFKKMIEKKKLKEQEEKESI